MPYCRHAVVSLLISALGIKVEKQPQSSGDWPFDYSLHRDLSFLIRVDNSLCLIPTRQVCLSRLYTLRSLTIFDTTAVSPDEDLTSPYNYVPTQSVCIIFLALFGVSTGNVFMIAASTENV